MCVRAVKDPFLFGGDTNLYGYVMQDPINFIDTTGNIRIVTPFTPFTSFINLATGGPESLNPNEMQELQKLNWEQKYPAKHPLPVSTPKI